MSGFWIGLIIFIILMVIIVYSCCVVSGRSDDKDQEIYLKFMHNNENKSNESTILSDLEKQSVDEIVSKLEV